MDFLRQHVVGALVIAFVLGQLSAAFLLAVFRAPDAISDEADAYRPAADRASAPNASDEHAAPVEEPASTRHVSGE